MTVELTDVDSVRQFMQKSASDKLQDEDIETLIYQASEVIQRHCNREFVNSGKAIRSFEFYPSTQGYELVDLKPYEYRAVEEVKIDPDLETPIVLPSSQYRVWPQPAQNGTYFGLRFAALEVPVLPAVLQNVAGAYPFQTRRVDVKAEWGMSSVPDEVQKICNVLVSEYVDLHLKAGRGLGQEGEAPGGGFDLPAPVYYGLRRWVRPTPEA